VFIIVFLFYLLLQALAPAPAPAPTSSAPSVTAAPAQTSPTAAPAPAPTSSAPSVTAVPAQKSPTAPAENVIPPLAAVVQSDPSPDPARSIGAESVMPADGLPPLFPPLKKKRESPKKETLNKMLENDKYTRRESINRMAKTRRRSHVSTKRKSKSILDEDAQRKVAAEHTRSEAEDMRAKKNAEELASLDDLINEAAELMDVGIDGID